ncbi:MAG: cobalt-precorrin-6A reductase [Pseudomonadota bacterium]
MTVLILAGSGEARRLCQALAGQDVIASLAGVTRAPEDLGVPTRVNGFGGIEGLRNFLKASQITKVIDATHPFAVQMTDNAAQACAAESIPHLILRRPGWQAASGDSWHWVDDLDEVPGLIPSDAKVFLATGRQSLMPLAGLAPRPVLARIIDPPDAPFPFEGGRYVIGKPPFSVEEEIDFFRKEAIDWVVVKNAGGAASFSKLAAARTLGLPVAIQRRPNLPAGVDVVENIDAALSWITR